MTERIMHEHKSGTFCMRIKYFGQSVKHTSKNYCLRKTKKTTEHAH